VSAEDAFWKSLKAIAAFRNMTLSALLDAIDSGRQYNNLSSSIRLFVLNFYRDQLEDIHSSRETIAKVTHVSPFRFPGELEKKRALKENGVRPGPGLCLSLSPKRCGGLG
jgi:predicted DNA-binding ribbon-helix-helix protein